MNGEFVGGSDIMMEMYQSGELQQMLADRVEIPQRLVVGITGATGAVYGAAVAAPRARSWGADPSGRSRRRRAHASTTNSASGAMRSKRWPTGHAPGDIGACLASGSFDAAAMAITPCSMKTLAAMAPACRTTC